MKAKIFGLEIYEDGQNKQDMVKNASITQFPVNSNIATTGHKLQGQTKKRLVIGTWNHRVKNWVYLVLSRVKTLDGLFLSSPLPKDMEKYRISDELKVEDKRLIALDVQTQTQMNWNERLKAQFNS